MSLEDICMIITLPFNAANGICEVGGMYIFKVSINISF